MSDQKRDGAQTPDGVANEYGRRRAPGLGILGVIALIVAAWGLGGGSSLPGLTHIAWTAVAVGLVAGLVLIIAGARSGG